LGEGLNGGVGGGIEGSVGDAVCHDERMDLVEKRRKEE